MAQALVEYNYDAVEPDELTIRRGDIITDIVFNSKGWWEGTLAREGKRGMFPDNFVKLMSDPDGLASSRQSPSGRKCKVLFSYKPAIEDELELQVGDIIDIIAEVEEGWWKGKLKDKIGVFPSNFVEETTNHSDTREASQRTQKISQDETSKTSNVVVQEQTTTNSHTVVTSSSVVSESSPIDVPALPPKPVKEMCKVIFNYEAANPDELTLHEGDIITLITREGQDPGWWKGEYKGKVGLFPDNFVQVITASEEHSPVSKPDRPSKVLPTSKSKDSINKAMTSSMSNIASISRKYSDNVRQDEKPNLLSKKPVLPPPPLKKPQRSSSDLAKSPTAPNLLSTKHVDTSPTILHALKPSNSTTTTTIRSSTSNSGSITVNSSSLTSSKRTIIEKSSDSLDGALWSKSGSYSITSESSHASSSVSSLSSTVIASIGGGDDLDLVGRAAMLTHPTASRVKAPKRRPPSTIYSGGELNNGEESSETTSSSLSTSASSTTVTTMLNGDADAHADKPASNKVPWVEELKLNQAKKQAGNNKTRVMIGGESTSSTVQSVTTSVSSTNISTAGSTSPEVAKTQVPTVTAGVTLRSHQAASTGTSTAPPPRPQSMVSSLKSTLVSPQSNDSTVTIPAKQWNDLLDKISQMELQFEANISSLTSTIKDLTAQLAEEKLRRSAMQHQLEKLTDLVTHV